MLSAAHLAVDMYCAVLFFGFISGGAEAWQAMVLYNAFAFAGQAPIGAITDRLGNGLAVAAAGCVILASAWFFHPLPIACAMIAGLGNGAFHTGAGYSVLMSDKERAWNLGVFVSTGSIGICIGTADASLYAGYGWIFAIAFTLFAAALFIFALDKRFIPYLPKRTDNRELSLALPKGGLFALICLTAVVVLRSFLGFTECFKVAGIPTTATVLCVAGGKAIGGFAADRLGSRKTSLVSLIPCAIIALFGVTTATGQVARLIALLLFNMTMPITLFASARLLKNAKGFAFGLLTFALFIGCIPSFMGADTSILPRYAYAGLIMLSLVLLILGLRFERGRAEEEM